MHWIVAYQTAPLHAMASTGPLGYAFPASFIQRNPFTTTTSPGVEILTCLPAYMANLHCRKQTQTRLSIAHFRTPRPVRWSLCWSVGRPVLLEGGPSCSTKSEPGLFKRQQIQYFLHFQQEKIDQLSMIARDKFCLAWLTVVDAYKAHHAQRPKIRRRL